MCVKAVTQIHSMCLRLLNESVEGSKEMRILCGFIRVPVGKVVSGTLICILKPFLCERWVLLSIQPHQQLGCNAHACTRTAAYNFLW